LRTTLLTFEAAASPKNQDILDATIQRAIPCIAVNRHCALDRALDLWFAAPSEFSQFTPSPAEVTPPGPSASEIQCSMFDVQGSMLDSPSAPSQLQGSRFEVQGSRFDSSEKPPVF
jgi:hypothetical protein